ncbi:MAG TPA: cupin domain-containing protein [Chloroflexota bacterium]
MGYVHRWADLTIPSTISGASTGLLPGQHLVAIYASLGPGTLVPYQTHPTEQLVHMLKGRLRIWIADEVHEVGPGDVVLIPPSVPHRGEAVGPENAEYLEVLTPVEERYRAMAAATRGGV